jgi:hypothetical protein
MHTLTDKILQVLSINQSTSSENLCLQLGRNWDDLQETVGLLRAQCWVWREHYYGSEAFFGLTHKGNQELQRRIQEAARS